MRLFITLLIILKVSFVFTQSSLHNNKLNKDEGTRLVIEPNIMPFYPILFNQFDVNNNNISIESYGGTQLSLKFRKYSPNKQFNYGSEMGILEQFYTLNFDENYSLREQNAFITPFISFTQKKKLQSIKAWYGELGLRYQRTLSALTRSKSNEFFSGETMEFINPNKFWWYLGVGQNKNIFNYSKYTGLSSYNIGLYLPLFNQNSLTNNINGNYPSELLFLKNSRTNIVFLTFGYSQLIDFPANNASITPYHIRETKYAPKSRVTQFLPPIFNLNKDRYNFCGNIYLHNVYTPQQDSLFIVKTPNSIRDTVNVLSNQIFKLGYTFNFLGNHKKFYNSNRDDEYANEKGLRYNLFTSVGLQYRYSTLKVENFGELEQLQLETSVGIRVGLFRNIYLSGGYTQFILPVLNNYEITTETYNDFNFSDYSNYSIFLALSYRNSIYFKVYYQNQQDVLEEKTNLLELRKRLSFSLGFGL